jgi:AcrR family transcriptional regulator
MKRVQRVAVSAFSSHGFDEVTVEQVAEGAGVSPISIYRWFGTKEALVLWDEYDPPLFEAIGARLEASSPFDAVRDGLIAELDRMYDSEQALVLDRARLIVGEPVLLHASISQQTAMVDGLVELFDAAGVDGGALEHRVLAGAAVGVLTVCLTQWAHDGGTIPMGELIGVAFETLRRSMCQT